MFYKQSTKNLKLVILSFDDVMFDLSKLRYNYYRRLCKLYNAPFDNDVFFHDLGSVRTMFSHCPIDSGLLTQEAMIAKIEEDLLAYCKMYGLKHRDGLVELLELFRQKKIPFVMTSTHPKQYTDPLYTLAALYHRPDSIFYDDELAPLPNTQLYQTILNQYQIKPDEVLLIAANRNSVIAANELRMNVIFVPSIENATKEMEIRCLKAVNNLLDVINVVLEAGHIDYSLGSYMLIRHEGSTQDLYQNYQHLLETYHQDAEILKIIETIYQQEFSKAQKQHVEATLNEQENASKQNYEHPADNLEKDEEVKQSVLSALESFLDEGGDTQNITNLNDTLKFQKMPTAQTNEKLIETVVVDEQPKTNPLADIETDDSFSLDRLESVKTDSIDQNKTNEHLQSIINEIEEEPTGLLDEDINKTKVFTKEEMKMFGVSEKDTITAFDEDTDDEEETDTANQPLLITSFIVNAGYAIMDAIMFVVIGGILMVGFNDWIFSATSHFNVIGIGIEKLISIAMILFGNLVINVSTFFHASNTFAEMLAVMLLLAIIFWILLDIISIVKKKSSKIENDE